MKINKTIVVIGLVLISLGVQAQKMPRLKDYDRKPYHFGFLIGINQMDFRLKKSQNFELLLNKEEVLDVLSVDAMPERGFNVGIVSNLRLSDHFDLRFIPDLAFGDRSIRYKYIDSDTNFRVSEKTIESTYVEFPFLLKYKGLRIQNTRPYLIGGLKYTLDLASEAKKKKEDNTDEDVIKLNQYDIATEVGVGFDFYLKYFKFATEVKMSYGLTNVLKNENTFYTNSIDKLNSKIFILSFLFE